MTFKDKNTCYDGIVTKLFMWMFCKKCLNKRKIYIDMSEAVRDFDEDDE